MSAESNSKFHQLVVLRATPYREYDLLVDLFSRDIGRISAVSSGSRRPKSVAKALIQPFNLISAQLNGRGELKRIVAPELVDTYTFTSCISCCAMYLNEILFYLLERNVPQPLIFDSYLATLNIFQKIELDDTGPFLRIFELNLLTALGYGIDFSCDSSGNYVEDDKFYIYDPGSGFVSVPEMISVSAISGMMVKRLGKRDFADKTVLKMMKNICQQAIGIHLGNHHLMSRELLKKFILVKKCV